jgi:predicted house-cleaning NTP pyrophosphatase (Maf/HAM1 superfamily)
VISTGDGANAGASKISGDIASIIAQVPATVEALTGLDLTKTITQLPGALAQAQNDDKPADKDA